MRLEQTISGQARAYTATPADRMHTATGLGARSSNQQRGRSVYASCLWPTMQYWRFLEGARDFKARSTAKEHTNEIQSGGRDPGVSRPLCSRPLDMGKRCVAAFRHGAFFCLRCPQGHYFPILKTLSKRVCKRSCWRNMVCRRSG